ncbi:hypothetical protein FJZ31_07205 [Candidatus Poribacteria bacterium]|nr:hypothetical protein [Candidatus Poribacteria bacterium]
MATILRRKLPRYFVESLRNRSPVRLTAEQEKLLRSLAEEYPDDVQLRETLERYLKEKESIK